MSSQNDYDVVIVGAGVSGALCANDLARRGLKLLVLEAGRELRHPVDQVPTFYNADAKTPGAPWPPELQAPRPSVLDMGIKDTFKEKTYYMLQIGKIPFNSTYERIGGGTTNHWLGTCLRHVPSDFRLKSKYDTGELGKDGRPLLEHARDWPITYDDLESWYQRAEEEIGVSGDSVGYKDYLGAKRKKNYPMPEIALSYLDRRLGERLDGQEVNGRQIKVMSTPQGRNSEEYDGRTRCLGNTSCIPICPVQAKYDATVHLNKARAVKKTPAEILYKRVAYKLDVDDQDQIAGIRYVDYSDSKKVKYERVTAKIYIVGAHAIETAKLLLMSKWKTDESGKRVAVANSSDQVGRNLMDHIIHLTWGLADEPLYPFRGPLSTTGIGEFRDSAKRSERSAYRIEIGNDGWSWPAGAPINTVYQILYGTEEIINNFFKSNPQIKQNWYGKGLRNGLKAVVTRQIRMAAEPEALPLPHSRVTVSDQIQDDVGDGNLEDAFRKAFENVPSDEKDSSIGIPKPQVDYHVSEYTKKGFAEGADTLAKIFATLGVKQVETRIVGDGASAVFKYDGNQYEYGGAGHIAGTYLMGAHPATSVVDKDCRSHDHKNLFLLGSGVFPALGTANPTLTIMALALRAADTIAKELDAEEDCTPCV